MSELRDRVLGAKVFGKINLKDPYHLIRIRAGDEWKTAFRTRYGHYEYKVMPFGLVNAPATFQAMMNKVLREFLDHGVVVYMDDILIYSENYEKHIELVKKVLARLEEHRLAISLKKSAFHLPSVEFLGYIVALEGVTMSERKVEFIKKWRSPRSVKEVQIFIGFANFYRRFIKDFSKICKPITETLKGNPKDFSWGKEQEEAFEELKHRFTTAPILAHFYPERETVVKTDASDFALGWVLSQFLDRRQHPVAFHSRKLRPAERNYEIHEKELLAILEAFTKWKCYLAGADKPITVYTDHQNLQHFLTTKKWNPRQVRWAQELANFNFKIVYCPGTRGGKPDALSRRPEYRPEEGAEHTQQSILKSEHFQVTLIRPAGQQGKSSAGRKRLGVRRLRIRRLHPKAKMPTKGSRMAAGHDIYAIEAIRIPARGQKLVETRIAVSLPPNTYAQLVPRSGLASKKGIDIGGGVIDADYTGEVKVIMINYSNDDSHIMEGERIARMIIKKIDMSDAMEVDKLEDTIRGKEGFGSTDLSPKRLVQATDTPPVVCILQANRIENKFFGQEDIDNHSRVLPEQVMVSSMTISKIILTNYEPDLIEKVERAGRDDQEWGEKKAELKRRASQGEEPTKNWQLKEKMIYFKNGLYIPNNNELKTEITKGMP